MSHHRKILYTALLLVAAGAVAPRAAVVTLPYKGPRQVEDLRERGVEILAFTKLGIDVLAEGDDLEYLRSRPYPVTVVESKERDTFAALDANLGLYHTHAETESVLTYLAATYPALAQKASIGTSLEGRPISRLKISDNVTVDEDEPEVLYMGNHHARELMSVEIPLRFATYLLENYGVDSEITGYINDREVYVIPMVNPDGHVYVQANHGGSSNFWWRKNRRNNGNGTFGVDLNRNYGFQWGYDNVGSSPTTSSDVYRGVSGFSEPETQRVRDFVDGREFVAWLSYHSYGELLLYPWGYIAANTPDHDVLATLADTLVAENGYFAGNPASGAIYITNGDADDWGYGEQITKDKILAYTPEVNSSAQGGFGPAESLIQPTFDLLLPMNVKLLHYADNPHRVLAPFVPTQYATQAPYANAITRLSWTAGVPGDPNPVVSYDVEGCLNPSFYQDSATEDNPDWLFSGGYAYTASGFAGGGYFSGTGDGMFSALTMARPFVVDASSDTLTFQINYDTESGYDYGYVDVSTDGGASWTPIQGNITTTFNPAGLNRGHGINGTSPGWVPAVFPLVAYSGQEIRVRLLYVTDGSIFESGIRVDTLAPVTTCESASLLASAVIDTVYDHVPPAEGVWQYRVRALDAEDHATRWSNLREREVLTVTGTDAPRTFVTSLGANYPNPFNPSTQIPFVVGGRPDARAARVELAIYSVTGARVATLVDEMRTPGTYTARWSGAGTDGHATASGVYFARLRVDGSPVQVRKLVLLK